MTCLRWRLVGLAGLALMLCAGWAHAQTVFVAPSSSATEQTYNLNIKSENVHDCVKEAEHFGATTYYNICNGRTTTIQWGGGNWLGMLVLYAVVTSLASAAIIAAGIGIAALCRVTAVWWGEPL